MPERRKILILGGGPAGLSAAYHLTSQPGWEQRYEITVHQLGWRLGGKGATGRDPDRGWRVQEHGIHGFCGFYDTTFRMMASCFEEAYGADGASAGGLPGTMATAFRGTEHGVLTEQVQGRWVTTPQTLPVRDGIPWVGPARLEPREALVGMLEYALRRHRPDDDGAADLTGHTHRWWVPHLHHDPAEALHGTFRTLLERARERVTDALLDDVLTAVAGIGALLDGVIGHLGLDHDSPLRVPLLTLDFVGALLRGVLTPDEHGSRLIDRDLDEVDDLSHIEWLRANGASEVTLRSALVNATPNILFAYPAGDTAALPTVSAATYVSWALRSYCILGHTYYIFPPGTGEGVIRPIYLALRERGVRFRFLSKLEEVVLDDDGGRVERLRMTQQAEVRAGPLAYEPLVDVEALGFSVWPDRPDWDQLVDGDTLRDQLDALDADLESWWVTPATATPYELTVGVDFDEVVWAIPPATLPYVGKALLDHHPSWRRQHEGVTTTATLGLQWWVDKPADELGGDGVVVRPSRYVTPSWPAPLLGAGEFTDVLAYEAWGSGDVPDGYQPPRSLWYACGPIEDAIPPDELDLDDPTAPRRHRERGLWTSLQWLRQIGALLPGAAQDPTTRVDQQTFDFTLLHTEHDVGSVPSDLLAEQWWKVNVDPPERYSQAPPGSAPTRLAAWGSGVANLVVAGDWIRTGINAGSFEGAVVGGALASHALTGAPRLQELPTYTFGHPGWGDERVEPRLGDAP